MSILIGLVRITVEEEDLLVSSRRMCFVEETNWHSCDRCCSVLKKIQISEGRSLPFPSKLCILQTPWLTYHTNTAMMLVPKTIDFTVVFFVYDTIQSLMSWKSNSYFCCRERWLSRDCWSRFAALHVAKVKRRFFVIMYQFGSHFNTELFCPQLASLWPMSKLAWKFVITLFFFLHFWFAAYRCFTSSNRLTGEFRDQDSASKVSSGLGKYGLWYS